MNTIQEYEISNKFSPFQDLENISQWLEQENKIDCQEWQLLSEVRSGLVKWKSGSYDNEWDQNQEQKSDFLIEMSNSLRSLLYGLDHQHNFKDQETRKSIDSFYQWLDKESMRCCKCDKSENETELGKCQGCRNYFCAIGWDGYLAPADSCWGRGNVDFCGKCKNVKKK